jgi:natural product precursor
MKQLSKLKLNQVTESNLERKSLKKIVGGACANYNCQCNGSGMAGNTSFVDTHLDGQSSLGYI